MVSLDISGLQTGKKKVSGEILPKQLIGKKKDNNEHKLFVLRDE